MDEEKNVISKNKLIEIKKELENLTSVKRKEIAESLKYAKSLGDLSENAEYQEARDVQAATEERISQIESILKTAVILTKQNGDSVVIGSSVVIKRKGSSSEEFYSIVGAEETNAAKNKISFESPMGEAVYGKKKGDKFSYVSPNGKISGTIVDIK